METEEDNGRMKRQLGERRNRNIRNEKTVHHMEDIKQERREG